MARILVVDDSPTETHQLVNVLAKHGAGATAAGNGRIDLANGVILMDVVMPGINGFRRRAN
jgi:twitching motility two-component system response regulator PilH